MMRRRTILFFVWLLVAAVGCGGAADGVETAVSTPPTVAEAGTMRFHEIVIEETTIDYMVATPDNFSTEQTYPVLLALPPGPQTQDMVTWGMETYWAEEGTRRGYVVISPVAPNGRLFFQGSESLLPEFLARMATVYQPEGGKFHVAGISNGGISAFRVAGENAALVQSVQALPGFPRSEADRTNLSGLTGVPVALYVGESDTGWIEPMQNAADTLNNQGGTASFTIFEGEGHVIQTLAGGTELFDFMDAARP